MYICASMLNIYMHQCYLLTCLVTRGMMGIVLRNVPYLHFITCRSGTTEQLWDWGGGREGGGGGVSDSILGDTRQLFFLTLLSSKNLGARALRPPPPPPPTLLSIFLLSHKVCHASAFLFIRSDYYLIDVKLVLCWTSNFISIIFLFTFCAKCSINS